MVVGDCLSRSWIDELVIIAPAEDSEEAEVFAARTGARCELQFSLGSTIGCGLQHVDTRERKQRRQGGFDTRQTRSAPASTRAARA